MMPKVKAAEAVQPLLLIPKPHGHVPPSASAQTSAMANMYVTQLRARWGHIVCVVVGSISECP